MPYRLSTTRHVANRTIRQRCRAYATHQQPPSQPQRAAPRSSLISQKTAKEWKELSTPQKGKLEGCLDMTERVSYDVYISGGSIQGYCECWRDSCWCRSDR